MLELSVYNDIAHGDTCGVEPKKAILALKWVCKEMEKILINERGEHKY